MSEAKKRNYTLFIFLCSIITLAVAGIIYWNKYKYKLINDNVKEQVFDKSNGLYNLHYDNIKVDEIGGYLYITNLTVTPDTALYSKMINNKRNPPLLLQLTIPEIQIAGVKTPAIMLSKKIEGRRVEVNNPTLIFYYAKTYPDTTVEKVKQEMYKQILGQLTMIKIDTIIIKNASVSFINFRNGKKTIEAENVSVNLQDVLIDSLNNTDSTRFFFAKNVKINSEKGTVKNKQGSYIYYFNGIDFSKKEKAFFVKEIKIAPQLTENEFAKFSKLQTDRFNVALQNISLKNINLPQLMDAVVIADTLLIGNSNFKIFRDLAYPRDKKNRVGGYPHQLLMALDVPISIKAVVFKKAFIEYKEKNPKSNYSGSVQFDDASASITNVTNSVTEIKNNYNCVLNFNARFMNIAPIQAKIIMPLNTSNGKFIINGNIKSFDVTKLNELLIPMGLAKAETGHVSKVQFNLVCDNYSSNGNLLMLYEDLNVTLLKKDSTTKKLEKKGFASFVANILVKNANPLRKQAVRKAEIHYKRDTNRSFFNLIWKSIFTGVKQTVGVE